MVDTTSFRTVNPELAGTLAQVARQQGSDIANVVNMLRNGTPIKAMASQTLFAGFQHAAKIWAGNIVLGLGEPAHIIAPQPGNDVKSVARKVALEVQSWLNEKKLVAGREVELIEVTKAQRDRFDHIIEALLRLTENATKTQSDDV